MPAKPSSFAATAALMATRGDKVPAINTPLPPENGVRSACASALRSKYSFA